MSARTTDFVKTLEAIHSVDTPPTDKFDLLTQLTKQQQKLTQSDLAELKQSSNAAVKDWLRMQS